MIASRMLAIGLAVVFAASPSQLIATSPSAGPSDNPRLVNTCVITNQVERLVGFYELILKIKAKRSGEDYAEFQTGAGVLAIFSARAQGNYIPGSAEAAKNKSVILEFQVGDVDKEYQRLQSIVTTWVKPPTTQPWGTRSIIFRDPDGNLVDFYTPPKGQESSPAGAVYR